MPRNPLRRLLAPIGALILFAVPAADLKTKFLDICRSNKQEYCLEVKEMDNPALSLLHQEEFSELWEQDDEQEATAFLLDWLARAEASGIRVLLGVAKTLRKHALGLLAYYDYPLSTGPLEGTNNKIKTMQRQAYGFRDQEFFKLKILACHEAKYALVG